MTSQGDFLIIGKCFLIQGSNFIVLEVIANWHSTYCSWRWRHKNYILPLWLIFPLSFWGLKICLHYHTTFQECIFSLWETWFFREFKSKDGIRKNKCGNNKLVGPKPLNRWFINDSLSNHSTLIPSIVKWKLIFQCHLDFLTTNIFIIFWPL